MGLNELLKRAGKGLVITAASVVAGAALGPIAAGAVGSFLSRAMQDIGVSIATETVEEIVQDKVAGCAASLMDMARPQDIEVMAETVAQKEGIPVDDAMAGLQYALRELQTNLSGIISEIRGDSVLLGQVFALASENGVKLDAIMAETQRTNDALEEVIRRLAAMERGLDISYRKFMGRYSAPDTLDINRLTVISKLQRQRMVGASGFGVRYNPELYVARTRHEAVFDRFLGDAGLSDRNIFVVLGDAGLGKTWYMAQMSARCVTMASPTFFVPLSHGIKSLTSIFHVETIPALIDLLDPVLSETGEHAYVFLDGLDEMDPSNIRYLLGGLATSRSDYVSFVVSCRTADWASNRAIVRGANELKYYIYQDHEATDASRSLGIGTPVSVLMTEFTDSELRAAMKKYGIPDEVPFDLLPLLSKPYILRLTAEWYQKVGSLPSPSSPEFLDLFAGGPKYADSVFRRLGILTERDSLYATVEKLIEAQCDSLPLFDLPIEAESSTFTTLVSSGMLRIRIDKSGTAVSLSPEFVVPLVSLTVLRYRSDPPRLENLLTRVSQFLPDKAAVISRIVKQFVSGTYETPAPSRPTRAVGSQPPSGETEAPARPVESPREEPPVQSIDIFRGTPRETTVAAADMGTTEEAPVQSIDVFRGSSEAPSRAPGSKGLEQSFVYVDEEEEDQAGSQASGGGSSSGYPPIVKRLIYLVNDSDPRVRRGAIMSLGLASTAFLEEQERMLLLRPFLDDPDSEFRSGAAWAIATVSASVKDIDERLEISRLLVEDEEWAVRRAGAFATMLVTSKTDAKRGREILEPLVDSVDGQIRSGALCGLGVAGMSYPDPKDAIETAMRFLEDTHDDVRGAAALALGLLASTQGDCSQIVEVLSPLPAKGYGRMRVTATMGLCLIGTRVEDCLGIVRTVTPLLEDTEAMHRSAAAIGLGLASAGLADAREMLDLIRPLLDDEEPEVRFSAGVAMGLVAANSSDPLVMLRSLTDSRDEYVRAGGALAAGIVATRFGDPSDAIELIRPLTADSERTVRRAAVMALGLAASKVKDIDSRVELLKEFQESPDDPARQGAAIAFGLASKEIEIQHGVVIGEALWGSTPFTREECLVLGMAMSLMVRFGY